MRYLLKFLKNYKKESIIGPLFKLTEACFELIIPLIMASIIDVGIAEKDTNYIIRLGSIMVLLGVLGLACSLTAQYFAAKASYGFGTELREELFRHIMSFSYSELDKLGQSTLINRMTVDVNQVQAGVNLTLRLFLRSPFLVIGAVIMAFTIDVKLALIFILSAPVIAFIIYMVITRTIPYFKKMQRKLDDITLLASENLAGARVIRAFSRQEEEKTEFASQNEEMKQLAIGAGRLSALQNPLTTVVLNAAIIAIIWFGGVSVDSFGITQGEVIALVNYMSQILLALLALANLIISITKATASAGRVSEILKTQASEGETLVREHSADMGDRTSQADRSGQADKSGRNDESDRKEESERPEESDRAEKSGRNDESDRKEKSERPEESDRAEKSGRNDESDRAEKSASSEKSDKAEKWVIEDTTNRSYLSQGSIEFRHVSFRYSEAGEEALTDVSFLAKGGETIGIIGGTGSGKTTLVNLMAAFYRASSGSILLNGEDINSMSLNTIRGQFGIVPQKAVLFRGTIRENLKLASEDASDNELLRALDIAQAKHMVEEKPEGLDTELVEGARNLSGGQKQRLTIARALVGSPRFLILDDSASALDYATDAALRKAIKKELAGTTIFLVSQRVNTIMNADKILVLDDGKLVGCGTHEELKRNCSVYSEICSSQFS